MPRLKLILISNCKRGPALITTYDIFIQAEHLCPEFQSLVQYCRQPDASQEGLLQRIHALPGKYVDVIVRVLQHRYEFLITGTWWGESTGHRWIFLTEGQWYWASMFPLLLDWVNYWTNNRVACDLKCHKAYDTSLQCVIETRTSDFTKSMPPAHPVAIVCPSILVPSPPCLIT